MFEVLSGMVKKRGPLKYEHAPDLQGRMLEIVEALGMEHVQVDRVECLRSFGSKSRGTIARCHTIGKLMQKAMRTKGFYAIEFLERFDKMNKADQDKTIIHELMHIPKTFGGGFRHHDHVCDENVDLMYERFEGCNSFKGYREAKLEERTNHKS